MRKDILERMKLMKQEGIKPNYAEIARKYDCDYRTVKKYFEEDSTERKPRIYKFKLDPFRQTIEDKLKLGCTTYSI